MRFFHNNHIILVDGKETYLLAHYVSDNGIILEISGIESIYLHEHIVTEYNGSPLKLS